MKDIKKINIVSNYVINAPNYDSNILSTLVHTIEAFARLTYQSVYLIDYFKQEFLYVSDNPLFLCGLTAKEVKELGYSFYLEHVPEEEQKMLVELTNSGFKFFDTFDNVDKYQCSMSYHFHLRSGSKCKLINHQFTPILLTEEGKIWIGVCVVSLSSYKTVGHVEFHKKGSCNYWKYSFEEFRWKECEEILLNEDELEVLRLSAAGLTMTEISDRMCRSVDTIKFYKRHAFYKLDVVNITEAISRAELNKLF
ncbi:MAG: helix-turn-helix transcriptional regulator [Bacteroidaceae bacterium]